MRNRMLIVGIALMLVVSAAIAQTGESTGTEVSLEKTYTETEMQSMRDQVQVATVAAQNATAALEAEKAKGVVAGQQIGEAQKRIATLEQAVLDAKNNQHTALKRLSAAQSGRAMHTGRKTHWAEARKSASELDKLDAEVKSLKAEYRQTQEYLHNGGYFRELQQNAGLITRSQADQLYQPKTPAIAPAPVAPVAPVTSPAASGTPNNPPPVPPAASGTSISQPAQTPAKENDMLVQGILIGIAAVSLIGGLIYLCQRAGLATLVAVLFTGVRTTAFYKKYDDVEITAGRGVVRVKGKKNP